MALLLIDCESFSQNKWNGDTLEIKNFSNEFLMSGEKGKIFKISSDSTLESVVVRWDNGYFAVGTASDGIPVGKWFVFDKKNRQREFLIIGAGAKCILYSRKMNSKGEIISEFKAITPCF